MPGRYLDARSRAEFAANPTDSAANIPLPDLPERPYELPPASEPIVVAETGPEAAEALGVLRHIGRNATTAPAAAAKTTEERYRLWHVPSMLRRVEDAVPATALCLACGVGREAVALAAAGWQVTAVDLLPDAIQRGRRLEAAYGPSDAPAIRWIEGDLRRWIPEFGAGFDLITQFFYADPYTAVRIARWLAPGGIALVETFSERHWRELGRERPNRLPGRLDWDASLCLEAEEGVHGGHHTTQIVIRWT